MAPVSLREIKPFERISEKAVPKPIRESLQIIFGSVDRGVWLAGGTAIAGFYAEHRRSDDIDLFCLDRDSQRIAVMAGKSLREKGAVLNNERTTPAFYHADVRFQNHAFTLDVVLDPNVGKVGGCHTTADRMIVADLQTLFAMKAACLVSRVSEKDLFDLDWFFETTEETSIPQILRLGASVDAGLTTETLLIALQGAVLRKEACHFLPENSPLTPLAAFGKIKKLRKTLIQKTLDYEKNLPPSPETELLRRNMKFPLL